ncbi:MAG TPA: PIG-L family deacetylase, partial [Longimicrobium sp.]|nr:PIG-L family deacetylase [Longimicrobium sp.]
MLAAAAAAAALVAACQQDRLPTAGGPPPEIGGARFDVTAATAEVFVHAHPDDWQLFMGDRAAAMLAAGKKTVFVYATAGDAGYGDVNYWQTREQAALSAVNSLVGTGLWTCGQQGVAGHLIHRCAKGNVSAWYLRLPDGNSGNGLGYGQGSLKLLRDQGTAVGAIDGSTVYASWADLTATLRELVQLESGGDARVHAPDWDRALNPADHPDHWATADLAKAAAAGSGWTTSWYVDYAIQSRPVNLDSAAYLAKRAAFLAYDGVMAGAGYGSSAGVASYQAWLWRTYARTDSSVVVPPVAPPPSGTAWSTSFASYPTGVAPAGWSQPWDPGPGWAVADEPSAVGGKVLRWQTTAASRNRWGLAFDGFGDVANQSVYTELRVTPLASAGNAAYMGTAAVRMGGSGNDEHGYALYFVHNPAAGARSVVLATWTNGAYNQLQDWPLAWTDGTWYSVRLEALGGHIRARVWPRGDAEPATWPVDVYDTRYPTGRPGVSNHDNGTV